MDDDLLGGPGPDMGDDLLGGGGGDDLLGGPPPVADGDLFGGGGDDDLLGGDGGGAAFEDDGLFGGGAEEEAAAPTSPQQSSPSKSSGPSSPEKAAKMLYPVKGQKQIATDNKETHGDLMAYVQALPKGNNCFHLQYMQYLHYDAATDKSEFIKIVLMITDRWIFFFPEHSTTKLYRKEKITDALAAVLHEVDSGSLMATIGVTSTERELVIQMDGQVPDIVLRVDRDPRNGFVDNEQGTATIQACRAAVGTLKNVLAAYGQTDFPIATIPKNYNISALVKPGRRTSIPASQRQHYVRSIALQLRLSSQVAAKEVELGRLENEATALLKTETGDQVVELQKETQRLSEEISEFKKKSTELQKQKEKLTAQRATLSAKIEEQRAKREETVESTRSEKAKQRMLKKVAAYELKKNEHKRMMDRINKLTAVYERLNSDRNGSTSYDGLALSRRIDVLQEQARWIAELSLKPAELHRKRILALAENRRRVATCKELITSLPKEIKILQETEWDQPIPEEVDTFDLPPVKPEIPQADAPPKPAAEPEPAPAPAAVDVDDDDIDGPAPAPKHVDPDDDDFDVAPAPKPATAINLDDDDDDLAPAPAPAAAAKIDLDDDDDDLVVAAPAKPSIDIDDDI